VLHAPPISFFSILSPARYWVRSTDYSAHHCVIFSIPPLPRPSEAQIFSSAPYSRTPSRLFFIVNYDQQMHNYFTNYHTPTCFDTCVILRERVINNLQRNTDISNAAVGNTICD
jgi:hypothetical protein